MEVIGEVGDGDEAMLGEGVEEEEVRGGGGVGGGDGSVVEAAVGECGRGRGGRRSHEG